MTLAFILLFLVFYVHLKPWFRVKAKLFLSTEASFYIYDRPVTVSVSVVTAAE